MSTVFATCDLCDAHRDDSSGSFRVLPPVFRDFGAVRRFCGQVVTVKCFEDNTLVKAALDSVGFDDTPACREVARQKSHADKRSPLGETGNFMIK